MLRPPEKACLLDTKFYSLYNKKLSERLIDLGHEMLSPQQYCDVDRSQNWTVQNPDFWRRFGRGAFFVDPIYQQLYHANTLAEFSSVELRYKRSCLTGPNSTSVKNNSLPKVLESKVLYGRKYFLIRVLISILSVGKWCKELVQSHACFRIQN